MCDLLKRAIPYGIAALARTFTEFILHFMQAELVCIVAVKTAKLYLQSYLQSYLQTHKMNLSLVRVKQSS